MAVWLAACRAVRRHRPSPADRFWPAAGCVAVAVVLVSVLVPLGDPRQPPAAPPGVGTWRLDDGAVVRYGRAPASAARASAAPLVVVVVHGGPGARQDRVYAASVPALHCSEHAGPPLHGLGFYAHQVPQSLRHPPVPDLRTALTGTRVPALVLKGQCDYLDWASAVDYVDVFPDSVLAYLPGAGHDAYLDRPDRYTAAVRAFLNGVPVPGRIDPRRVPHGYQP
jgi:pimeloyl-ACP methyl ester carboxylesterase